MRALRDLPAARAVLLVAATSLFMVLVAWATLIGPGEVFTGPGRIDRPAPTQTRTCLPLEVVTGADGTTTEEVPDNPRGLPLCEQPAGGEDRSDPPPRSDAPLWLQVLAWVFLLAVLAGVLAAAVLVVRLARDRSGPRRRERREAVEFTTLDEPDRLVEAITEDAAEQDAVLGTGDPRNAIVAAWLRFEVQGASAGVGRRSWETSSEYALRILDLVSADSGAVTRLADLYREARFSQHPITEDHRSRALEALATIRRSLEVRT
ncbi:DUF4129 domain-containing protein [Nocardioides sp. zg-1308]|uniref:DUF4129 domain-containing protein n=1 Tax=Nocardioides sp. zg-1308 TaxID=2736253 RepID=UPI0015516A2F|nr:DUF4129 domain-containing protein [Nocardioides sp. zg-1308]NPD05601.1 DUF4129 domain-containing protein [Nocardioides sp. zg-1308]